MKKLIRTIIIDDEPGAVENLGTLLNAHPEIRIVGKITDTGKAVRTILDERPDLLFLDIQMPGKTGFEIVRELTETECCPAIIFVTAFDRYAIDAIRHAAFDFLLKPVNPEELSRAIDRLHSSPAGMYNREQFTSLIEQALSRPKIKISTAGGFTLINPSDVIYIQADWNYSELFFNREKSEMTTMNIGSLDEVLPKKDFFRISRSLIINVAYLVKVSRRKRQVLLVKDGQEYIFPIPLLNIRKLESFLESF